MSNYSKYLKSRKLNDLKYFFGEDVEASTDYKKILDFKHYKNDNEIIVITNDVKPWKEQFVLVVDNNKVVFLKPWQVRKVKNWGLAIDAYAVKLKREYFKPYELKFSYDDMYFKQETTFDNLVNIAREQDENKTSWKLDHYEF